MEAEFQQKWTFGTQIGGGGFARVVKATNENGEIYAAKFVEKQPGASRELLLANLDGVRNVVPVVDVGEVDDKYVLVMPLAERSLRDHMDSMGPLPQADALHVLVDIATALADLEGNVIHRDLKPENVLFLNGSWCLSDFGIARYAEASTQIFETRKGYFTWHYAAPEQWSMERASSATDVYAFGILAFELLEGIRPFEGTMEDLREAHLHMDPPEITREPVLASIVHECLFKAPQARPKAANLLARLEKVLERDTNSRWARLDSANLAEVQRRVATDAQIAREQDETKRREQLFDAAISSWNRISEGFLDVIETHLSAATVRNGHDNHWSVTLNGAKFGLSYPTLQQSQKPELPFDVITTATLSVLIPGHDHSRSSWVGRSHSLYFADVFEKGDYDWFETAFMNMPLMNRAGSVAQEPFAVDNLNERALHHVLSGVLGRYQVAWEFTRVELDSADDFIQRWLDWFAMASEGKLHRPNRMPEYQVPRSWRR